MRGLLSWKKETWEIVSWSLDTKVTNIIIQLAWKLAFSFAPCVRPENTRLDFYEIWSVLSKQAIWCHIKTEEETHFHPATQDYHFRSAQGIVIVIRVHSTLYKCTLYDVHVWGLSGQNVATCSFTYFSPLYSDICSTNCIDHHICPTSKEHRNIVQLLVRFPDPLADQSQAETLSLQIRTNPSFTIDVVCYLRSQFENIDHQKGVPKNPKVRILECHLPQWFS